MAVDRKLDRHDGERGQHVRMPSDLWKRFTDAVGSRARSPRLAELVAWYLGEGPAPKRPSWVEKPDKPGQRHGA
jgi:hypothetical protein